MKKITMKNSRPEMLVFLKSHNVEIAEPEKATKEQLFSTIQEIEKEAEKTPEAEKKVEEKKEASPAKAEKKEKKEKKEKLPVVELQKDERLTGTFDESINEITNALLSDKEITIVHGDAKKKKIMIYYKGKLLCKVFAQTASYKLNVKNPAVFTEANLTQRVFEQNGFNCRYAVKSLSKEEVLSLVTALKAKANETALQKEKEKAEKEAQKQKEKEAKKAEKEAKKAQKETAKETEEK